MKRSPRTSADGLLASISEVFGAAPTSSARASFSLSSTYARRQILEIAQQLLSILLLVEAILLAERLADILENLLSKDASSRDIGLLILYAVPQVFNLAFPIAILISIYRTLLSGRERREFVVLAGMGVSSSQFLPLLLLLGFVMQLCSFVVSDVVEPASHFLSRSTSFSMTYQALRGGTTSGQTFSFPNSLIYVAPRLQGQTDGPLFIQRLKNGTPVQVTTAENAHLVGPEKDGTFNLRMRGVFSVDLDAGPEGRSIAPKNNIRVADYSQEISLDDILRFAPRDEIPQEQSSLQILTSKKASPEQVSEFGIRIVKSILCLLAPLVACTAMLFTSSVSQAVVLPAFCALMMGIDIAATTATKTLAAAGVSTLSLAVTFIVVAAILIVAMIQIVTRRLDLLVSPRLMRA